MELEAFGDTPQLALVRNESDDCAQFELDDWVTRRLLPLLPSAARLICIDGLDGVGKSTIAKAAARHSGARLIELDAYLQRDQGRYLSALDLPALEHDLRSETKVIAEGCLIQSVLAKCGLNPDFSIYVARTTQMLGHPDMEWIDERELLLGDQTAEEIIAREEDALRRWAEMAPHLIGEEATGLPGLTKELIAYHREFLPHKSADLILRSVRIS